MTARRALDLVHDAIRERCASTATEHPWWPCRRGCDDCCRSLAEVPRLHRAEWERLREGIDALPPSTRAVVRERVAALRGETGRVVCPMLDRDRGVCLVYEHRPAACRTYGFYVQRADILGCSKVVEAVDAHRETPPTWGNQASVDAALAALGIGDDRALTDWMGFDP